jgi:hypothetical protein
MDVKVGEAKGIYLSGGAPTLQAAGWGIYPLTIHVVLLRPEFTQATSTIGFRPQSPSLHAEDVHLLNRYI